LYYYIFKPERMRERRKELGYKIQNVAYLAECDHSNLSRIELGKRSPTADILGRVAGVLGVNLDYFFEKEKVEKPKE